ncbi:Flr1p [Sugiyamaella lignohabitans]|uniref:Flr1p n=1 Tax=Sugiyamaella lignohabitans TaxID=796027 RepID=A0A167F7X7_9ASCO|nr:Flr1p [Sugiyamaella lignohabitans]ANB14928.1 Flr1p [Sugiyamaella lignohabitans]
MSKEMTAATVYVVEDVSKEKEETSISYPESTQLKVDKHGNVLDPQPSDNPHDPLNWSNIKKSTILLIVSFAAFLPDYGSATGAVMLIPQAAIWNTTPDTVNHSQAGNVIMLGFGGLVACILSSYFGRAPVLFWFIVNAVWTAVWCATATSFNQFMAARILNGFFSTVSQGCGMMFIEDMFYFTQKPRRVNILSGFIIFSPYLGPSLSAFMLTTQSWRTGFGLYSALTGLALILIVLFVDETYYDRTLADSEQPKRVSRFLRLIGTEQFKSRHLRNSFKDSIMRPIKVLMRPTMFLSSVYYAMTFAWVVGINTTLSIFFTSTYNFGLKQIGFFYFTPIVATLLAETTGHWLHDYIGNRYIKRHNGEFRPETRLQAIFLSFPFTVAGLVLLGFALEKHYHYMVASLGWGMYVFSVLILTTALNAYNLDCYPEASGEINAWINFSRATAGFAASYFMIPWLTKVGAIAAFSIMAGICAVALCIIIFMFIFGPRLRKWSGPLNFHTF